MCNDIQCIKAIKMKLLLSRRGDFIGSTVIRHASITKSLVINSDKLTLAEICDEEHFSLV